MRSKYTCLRKNLYPDGHKYLKKPNPIESSGWKILSKMMGLLLLFLFMNKISMAQPALDLTKCYGSCTSNDFTALDIYLSKAVTVGGVTTYVRVGENDCASGGSVDTYLSFIFRNNTQSDRNGIFVSGTVNGQFYSFCFPGVVPKNQIATYTETTNAIPWTCGTDLILQGTFIGWGSAGEAVCSNTCSQVTGSKCRQLGDFFVNTPLIPNFTPTANCTGGNAFQTVSFDNTTSGGYHHYGFLWEFGDGATSTDENPSHTYSSAGSFNVKLSVTDTLWNLDADGNPIRTQPYISVTSKNVTHSVEVTSCCTTPVISNKSTTICDDGTVSLPPAGVTGDVIPADTKYTWTIASDPVGAITGGSAQASAVVGPVTQTLSNSTSSPATLTYNITPSSGSCTGNSFTYTVTVRPELNATLAGGKTICYNASTTLTISGNAGAKVVYKIGNTNQPAVTLDGTGSYTINTGALTANTTYALVSIEYADAPVCQKTISGQSQTITVEQVNLVINTPTAPCTPGTVDLTAPAITSGSTPSGLSFQYYLDNNGVQGTLMTLSAAQSVTAGSYWIKATSANQCSDEKKVTIAENNCGGLIYATATTCKDFLAGVNTLDKICYTVTASTKGNKTTYGISNATPGVFFYYARIQAPSNLPITGGSFTVNVEQFNTSAKVANPKQLPNFAVQQGQVFAFDGTSGSNLCTKMATGSESPKGSGNATITITAKPSQYVVISVKYDVKTLVGQVVNDIIGPDYQAYFISKVTYAGETKVINSTAGNIHVYNCSAPVTNSITAARVKVTEQSIGSISVTAYPNPYTDNVRFILQSPESGQGTLDIYNVLGQKIRTLYQGHITAGQPHNVEYHVPSAVQGTLLYFFKVNGKQVTGKLLNIKN